MSKVVRGKYTSEAVCGFNHRTAVEEAARCLLCHDAPCSKGCPAGTDPAKFIRSIRFRNIKGAAETIRENNPLGGTCARICPYDRLCEEACSRCGIDRPIEIGKLQRYAIEQEEIFEMNILEAPETVQDEKIACIGAGPASLACSAELAKAGYQVTVFEREEKAGGVLTYGIVPSRLPQEVVEHDIRQIEKLGVKFQFGKEVNVCELSAFDAVFLGIGLWEPKLPEIDGIHLKGVYSALEYLKEARIKKEGFEKGTKVVVVGGGDVAVDCAVTAKLLGAEEVRMVYRRTLEEAPGNMTEFQYALSLGIGITTNMAPSALRGKEHVEFAEFKGRDGLSELKISCDTVIFAIGQRGADMGKAMEADNVFAAGDIVNGGKTAVEAVAEGKAAAADIIKYLDMKGVK
ncbi:FAD-dependent oxidoreductase [Aminipila sp.]|uniref:FAD-dependent oxidoreductase n=1 Tax=Aminipila sp. TaxID=2060095 RepID=UPI0028A07642|nr:FAD-dependent oxidoreductase [Aminipila sp.]